MLHSNGANIDVYATGPRSWFVARQSATPSSGPLLCGDRISATPSTLVGGRRCGVSVV